MLFNTDSFPSVFSVLVAGVANEVIGTEGSALSQRTPLATAIYVIASRWFPRLAGRGRLVGGADSGFARVHFVNVEGMFHMPGWHLHEGAHKKLFRATNSFAAKFTFPPPRPTMSERNWGQIYSYSPRHWSIVLRMSPRCCRRFETNLATRHSGSPHAARRAELLRCER